MDWSQSRLSYYTDWALVPLLMLLAAYLEWSTNGLSLLVAGAAVVGYAGWTLAEYWIHRTLFHHFMRREHWLHHKQPRGWVSAPGWLTVPIHILLFGVLLGSAGTAGTGLFLGLEAGYFGYITVHDRIHHGKRASAYIQRRARLHDVHHTFGSEKNFGVVSSFWDHRFGTYYFPQKRT